MKKRQRQKISREFKLEAVRLLELGEKPVAQLALELGIARNRLYKWRADLSGKGDDAFRGAGRKAAAKDSEVARLRRELARVSEERDILKKAAAYFARELP
jgi:transposase